MDSEPKFPEMEVQNTEIEIRKEKIISLLRSGYLGGISEAIDLVGPELQDPAIKDPKIAAIALEAIENLLSTSNYSSILLMEAQLVPDLVKKFSISKDKYEAVLEKVLMSGNLKIAEFLEIPENIIENQEIQSRAKSQFENALVEKSIYLSTNLKQKFHLPDEFTSPIVKEKVKEFLASDEIYFAKEVCQSYGINEQETRSLVRESFFKCLENGTVQQINNLRESFEFLASLSWESIAAELISSGRSKVVAERFEIFSGDIFDKARANLGECNITVGEYFILTNGLNFEISEHPNKTEYQNIFEKLKQYKIWEDEQNITRSFEEGAKIFGYDRMFAFIHRNNLTRHDGLHAFQYIINLYNTSGANPENFYGNILQQVANDDAQYESGSAHHELNQIAQTFNADIEGTLSRAKRYSGLQHLSELVKIFESPEAIFASWKNLKRYHELSQLLVRGELLDKLQKEQNPKLRTYVETLALHPYSSVDMQKVFEFWQTPENFLDSSDEHTPEEIHNRKKPSNLTEIPHLDLSPEDLRDALVEGSLDKLQAFAPMEVEYQISYSLREQIRQALGSRQNKISGLAENPGNLFKGISTILKPTNITVQKFLEGEAVLEDVEEQIQQMLDKPGVGLKPDTKKRFPIYQLKMQTNAKSDPEGALAGNDTACCMPFGSGKNNVYTFNPSCTHATLQLEREDNRPRTIAQSVLTRDRNIGRNVSEVMKIMREQGEHLERVVPEDLLHTRPAIVACDNVEVAPNYKEGDYPHLIETVYRDFFAEYLSRFGEQQNFTQDRVVIGKGYSDALTDLKSIPNITVPETPVGYSDKTHEAVYDLPTKQNLAAKFAVLSKEVKFSVRNLSTSKPKSTETVADLTFNDCLPAAYIEGKAYASNQSLMEYLWKIENTLIAKDISNTHKNRPNMSFKYESDGKIRGYMIAYEGVLKNNEANSGSQENSQQVVYIADLAVSEPGTLGGGRAGTAMIKAFVENYGREYLQKGKLMPIFAYAREQTSYKLLQRELEKLSKDLNMKFEMEEGKSYQTGEDTMHPVLIKPIV